MLGLASYILICIALAVSVWKWPSSALAALLTVEVLDFWGQIYSPFLTRYGLVTNIYMVLLVGVAILRAYRLFPSVATKLSVPVVLSVILWLYAFTSLSWSLAQAEGLSQWQTYIPYIGLSLLLPYAVKDSKDFQSGLAVLVAVGAVLLVLTNLFIKWNNRFMEADWDTSVKFWNALAIPEMGGFVAIAACLGEFPKSTFWKLLRITAVAASMIAAVKAGTRGQFVLIIMIPIAFLPLSIRMNNVRNYFLFILIAAITIGGAYWIFMNYGADSNLDNRWSGQRFDSDMAIRTNNVARLLTAWWEQSRSEPFTFFFGLGNSASFSRQIIGFYPHVMIAEVLGEEGVLGVVLLIALLGSVINLCFKLIFLTHEQDKRAERKASVTLIALFAYTFVLSCKQGSFDGFSWELLLPAFLMVRYRQLLLNSSVQHSKNQPVADDPIVMGGRFGIRGGFPNLMN